MIKLPLERINAKSPYEVKEAGGGYEFRTEGGILYRIRFLEENPIGGCNTKLRCSNNPFLQIQILHGLVDDLGKRRTSIYIRTHAA